MTTYQCDTCTGEASGGAAGTSFLVNPDGRTEHFCSQACLRAFVNRQEMGFSVYLIIGPIIGGALVILYAVIERIVNH